jgi:hypothetical protein
MKKVWQVPVIDALEMGATKNDTVSGAGGDNLVWMVDEDGIGFFAPDHGDFYTTAAS